MNVAVITGQGHTFDRELAQQFVAQGYRVFAMGKSPVQGVVSVSEDISSALETITNAAGRVDMLIEVADERRDADRATVRDGLSQDAMEALYRMNAVRPMAVLEGFLPLLDQGNGKRLCFVTSAAYGSINEARNAGNYGYSMSKTALHEFCLIAYNKLCADGYTLRLFDPLPGEVEPAAAARAAYVSFARRRAVNGSSGERDDEKQPVIRDALGRQHAW